MGSTLSPRGVDMNASDLSTQLLLSDGLRVLKYRVVTLDGISREWIEPKIDFKPTYPVSLKPSPAGCFSMCYALPKEKGQVPGYLDRIIRLEPPESRGWRFYDRSYESHDVKGSDHYPVTKRVWYSSIQCPSSKKPTR